MVNDPLIVIPLFADGALGMYVPKFVRVAVEEEK